MVKGVRTLKYGEVIPVIGEIFREGETGTLLLQNDPTAKYLYFQSGQVIFAASNAPEDKFTQILLEEGKLKEEQLDMAMQKKGSKTIAKTLTELGFISSQDLLASLISQVYRIAGSVVHWTDGTASFKPDVLPQGVAKLPLSTQRFILDLTLGVENRSWALQVVGGMDKTITINKAEMDVALGLQLAPEEEKIIRSCSGNKSIEDIASVTGVDPFKTVKLLIGLHVLGLAHPKRGVESVTGQAQESAQHQDEKHLDLSFLEQALPDRQEHHTPFELASPSVPEASRPEVVPDRQQEFKAEKIERPIPVSVPPPAPEPEPEPEPIREVVQQPLFQPTFLPVDERRMGDISEPNEPRVILTPPNPMPKRTPRHLKFFIGLGASVVVITVLAVVYLFFFSGKEEHLPPPKPPKAIPKKTEIKTPVQTPSVSGTATTEQKPSTESPAVQEAAKIPIPEKNEAQVAVIQPKEPEKVEAKKPEPPPVKEPEKPAVLPEQPSSDPSASMAKGDYDGAAAGFKRIYSQKKGGYTIALMIACEKDTIRKSLEGAGDQNQMVIFPHNFKGRGCFRVIWGWYATKSEAESAFAKLPAMFRDSGARVVPFESMRP